MKSENFQKTPISDLKISGLKNFTEEEVRIAANVVKRFGQQIPIVVDNENNIVLGDIFYYAVKNLGTETVDVIKIDNLSKKEIKAYTVAINRVIEFGDFDIGKLTLDVKDLLFDDSFEISPEELGFSTIELDNLVFSCPEELDEKDSELDNIPEVNECITKPGDLIKLGNHILYCGDALNPDSYEVVLDGKNADIVIVDPPYNVKIQGNVTKQKHHKEFSEATGEMSTDEFTNFLSTAADLLAKNSKLNSIHYYFMDWRHTYNLLAACNKVYPKQLNMCIWNKLNGGMGSFYRSQHELCFVFQNGKGKYRNNIQLGKNGRTRTNVWNYLGMNTSTNEAKELRKLHPTVKPVAMIVDILLDASNYGDIVLDSFGGSGSTLIAAEECGRSSRLIEISPTYCDVIIARWEVLTGKKHEVIERKEK